MKQFYLVTLFLFFTIPVFSTTPLTGADQVGTTNSIRLTWGETDVNLSSPDVSLNRYQISYGEIGQTPTIIDNISSTLREYTVTGLSFGKTYEVKIIEVIRVNIPPNPFTPPYIDNFNPSSSLSVTVVVGNLPPVARCQNITKSAGSGCSVTITASEINNGSSDPENGMLTYSLNTTGPFGIGTHFVRLTVTDVGGLSSFCDATVTVVDDTAPTVATKEATLFLDNNGGATLALNDVLVGFADNCGTVTNVELSKTAFGCGDLGEQEVTVSVSDNAGNVNRTMVKVTVKDAVLPLIIPQNQTFHLAPNGYATLQQGTLNNMVRDNCGISEVKASKTTFSCHDLGDNIVTITAKDASGNETGATIIVTISDITPPVAQLKDAVVYLDGNGFGTLTMHQVDNGSTDNCGIAQMELSRTGFNCNDLGEPEVILFLLDNGGNSTYARVKVTVVDTLKPVVHVKSTDLYLGVDGRALLSIPLIDSMVADNCGIAEMEFSKGEFFQSDLGENRVVVTATDFAGNQARAIITVNVIDAVSPQVSVENLTLFADEHGEASLTVSQLGLTVVEAGKLDSIYLSQSKFVLPKDSLCQVMLTAIDVSGSVGVDTFLVVLKDTMNVVVKQTEKQLQDTVKVEQTAGISPQSIGFLQSLTAEESIGALFTYGPNPTDGEVRLFFNVDQVEVPKISLTDVSGRSVQLLKRPKLLTNRTLGIDIRHLQTGVYLLTIQQDYLKKIVRIVKE